MLRRRMLMMIGGVVALALAVALAAGALLAGQAARVDRLGEDWADLTRWNANIDREVTAWVDTLAHGAAGAPSTQIDALRALARSAPLGMAPGPMLASLEAADGQAAELVGFIAAHHAGLAEAQRRWRDRQAGVARDLRLINLGLMIGFLALINFAVVGIVRASRLVVEPAEDLADAVRAVAHGRFEARADEAVSGELGTIARAVNVMAANLGASEARRVEAVRQAAASINHEINNAVAALDMQLRVMEQAAQAGEPFQPHAHAARAELGRIAKTTRAIGRIRRIVLTEYAGGETMLDLEQSTRFEEAPARPPSSPKPCPPSAPTATGPGRSS